MASTFDTLLGKLSSLIGDDNPEATAYGVKNALFGFPGTEKVGNALNPDPQVTNRASMLPIGNYDDGSVGLAWPQSAVDAYEALGRFGRGENPQPQDAVLAGLAMAGSGIGHLGLRAAGRAVSGAAPESVAASRTLPSHSVEAGSAPVTARVYRGASNAEQWPPQYPEHNVFWASDDPAAASNYTSEALKWGGSKASVTPADVTFENPMVVDAAGRRWDGFGTDTNALARRARAQGHDGLIVRNVIDNLTGRGEPATTYAALQPGTVRSATTGETLFSNPKEAAPAGLVATANAGERQGIRAYHGSPHDFDRFDASKIGTGEGAQAYGHGLYFAENEGVARSYRDAMKEGSRGPGRMYEVRLNAQPDQLLDLAKPLSQQSDSVRQALEPIVDSWLKDPPFFLGALEKKLADRSISGQNIMDIFGAAKSEYQKLFESGIPGARYLDRGSRGSGEGTANYVVFPGNENLIDILRKYSNAPEAAPAGLLATSSLDRMRVEDAARPRSIPDAPQSMTELETLLGNSYDRYGQDRAPAARAEDPQRYWDYANGLHDVLNPESEWFNGSPTLQSGGSMAPAAATSSSEHHSRSQPRGEGGRFVSRDSFDGKLAALDKMMVDLDGDGTPDVALPVRRANALLAQASPSDKLQERGYLDQLPPPAVQQGVWGEEQANALQRFMQPRVNTLMALGVPPHEADSLIRDMPDVRSEWERLGQEGKADPRLQEEIRRLEERLR